MGQKIEHFLNKKNYKMNLLDQDYIYIYAIISDYLFIEISA